MVASACLSSSATSVRFDFGNGSVDGNSGVAANFVIAENQAFGVAPGNQSLMLGGVELTIAPIVGSSSDFSQSQWGANSQGIGIRSRDSGGGTSVDQGSNGGQRRRISGEAGEAIQFSFDTDLTIESVRLGSLAPSDLSGRGDIETAEISFVSGVDPFGSSSWAVDAEAAVNTLPTEDLVVNVFVEAGTVLSLTASTPVTGGVLWNDIVVNVIPEPGSLALFLLGTLAIATSRTRMS